MPHDLREEVEQMHREIHSLHEKVDNILRIFNPNVITPADERLARSIRNVARTVKSKLKAIDEKTPSAVEPVAKG